MMNYVSSERKILVGRNNQKISPWVNDFDTETSAAFTFINSSNQIIELPDVSGYYFAGSWKMNPSGEDMLWLCKDFTVDGGTLTFTGIDTYTSGYFKHIKKKFTEIDIEIGLYNGDDKQVLLRDIGLANPRVYLDGVDPHDIDLDEFATEEWVEDNFPSKEWLAENYPDREWVRANFATENWVSSNFSEVTPYELPVKVSTDSSWFDEEPVEWTASALNKIEFLEWTEGTVMSFPTMEDKDSDEIITSEIWVRIASGSAGPTSFYIPNEYYIVNEDAFPESLDGTETDYRWTWHIFVLRRGRGIVELTYSHKTGSGDIEP